MGGKSEGDARRPRSSAAIDRDIGQALSVVRDLRARAIAGWSGGALVPTTLPFRGRRAPRTPTPARLTRRPDRGATRPLPPPSCSGHLLLALDRLEEIMMGKALDRNVRDKRLAVEAATATIKAAIATDKNMLKAPRPAFPYSLERVSPEFLMIAESERKFPGAGLTCGVFAGPRDHSKPAARPCSTSLRSRTRVCGPSQRPAAGVRRPVMIPPRRWRNAEAAQRSAMPSSSDCPALAHLHDQRFKVCLRERRRDALRPLVADAPGRSPRWAVGASRFPPPDDATLLSKAAISRFDALSEISLASYARRSGREISMDREPIGLREIGGHELNPAFHELRDQRDVAGQAVELRL